MLLSERLALRLCGLGCLLSLAACCGQPSPPKPSARRAASQAVRAGPARPAQPSARLLAAGNLDGVAGDEVVAIFQDEISLFHLSEAGELTPMAPKGEGEPKIPGGPSVVAVHDLDGDGRAEVLVGYGQTRAERSPPQSLALVSVPDAGGPRQVRLLHQSKSERPDVTAITVGDLDGDRRPEIVLGRFESKYLVTALSLALAPGESLQQGAFVPTPLPTIRMAMYWAAGDLDGDGKAELVVGRPYGEEQLAPGDLGVLRGERREMIPTRGGVRSVAVGDVDGDGVPEILFGDGWDADYGAKAKARLNVARRSGGGYAVETIDESPGQFEIKQIEARDLDGDGVNELVAAGNMRVAAYTRLASGWTPTPLADGDGFAVASAGKATFVLVAGTPIKVVPIEKGP